MSGKVFADTNILVYSVADDSQKRRIADVVPITDKMILSALNVMLKYRLGYWDSLILAAALESECEIVYSEDMQHRQNIEGRLIIVNPFRRNTKDP